MNYIKLFEAFKSKVVSNVLKYIKKKVSKDSYDNFIKDLSLVLKKFDYPISELSDDYVKYLSYKSAIKLKNEKQVTNPYGIWVIKFWFSLEDGYLGFSGTGNKRVSIDEKVSFSENELNFLKKTEPLGEIKPVDDYNNLKIGQTVILKDDFRMPKFAKIYIDSNSNSVYCIGSFSGSSPSGTEWHSSEFTTYGGGSWWIYNNKSGETGSDHSKLSFFIPGDEPLSYKYEKETDPLSWNLKVNTDTLLLGRRMSFSSKDSEDYCVVLYLDDLVNPDADAPYFEPVSSTSEFREKEKFGATALLSNEEFKKINIERYLSFMSKNLSVSLEELKYPKRLVEKLLNVKYAIFNILSNDTFDAIDKLNGLITRFNDLVESTSDREKKWIIDDIKQAYEMFIKTLLKASSFDMNAVDSQDMKECLRRLFKLSSDIISWVDSQSIETFSDFIIVVKKLESIQRFYQTIRKSSEFRWFIHHIYYPNYQKLNEIVGNNVTFLEESNKIISNLERYCESILK